MRDVSCKRCLPDSCTKRLNFNFEGNNEAYCKQHVEDGMANVFGQRCLHDSRRKGPSFNVEGRKEAHCKHHAEDRNSSRYLSGPSVNRMALVRGCWDSSASTNRQCALRMRPAKERHLGRSGDEREYRSVVVAGSESPEMVQVRNRWEAVYPLLRSRSPRGKTLENRGNGSHQGGFSFHRLPLAYTRTSTTTATKRWRTRPVTR